MKILGNRDFAQNEIQNVKIQNLASAPSTPVNGQIYFDTTLHQFGVYNGTSWVYLGTGGGTVTTESVVSANGFAGSVATPTTTPAITITTTVTGLLKGNGTAVSAAASGTDYAPATSGSAALKGNGSGGFASATLNDVGAATADYSMNSHKLTSVTDPVSAQDAATKNYVDVFAQGLQIKPTARLATAAALPANTYANGTSGVGATLTATANAALSVDGVAVAVGDVILVKNEATAANNGLYTVTATGSAGAAYVLTRHIDMDTTGEFSGGFVPVGSAGTANANSLWLANPSGTVTVGTTSIPFTQLNGATDLIAGTGITITGNTIAVASTTAHKATATIGNGSSTSIAVTDGLGTIDKIATVRDASTGALVECDITYSSTQVTFVFAVAPATNAYNVVIIG